jgi:hypothetical protein
MQFDIKITRHKNGNDFVHRFACPLCTDGGMAPISDYNESFVASRAISHLNFDHLLRVPDLVIETVDAPKCDNEVPLSRDLNLRCTLEDHAGHIKHENVYRVGAMDGKRVIVQWQVIG